MKRFSLLTDDMSTCYISGRTDNIHIHEVYFGTANRKKSIKWGCCIPLTAELHTESNKGVHHNDALNKHLKEIMQVAFEEKYSKEKFMSIFNKNYL